MNKIELRDKCLSLRRKLNKNKASHEIVSKIKRFDKFQTAEHILIFYPMKYEIDLLDLTFENKRFYLPKVDGDSLLIYPFSNNLKKSKFGVMEPFGDNPSDISLIDIAFVPALCIDKNLNRIGYGKGYYDKFFSNPEFKGLKVGVIYKELIVDKIDNEIFDKKLDYVVTD